MKKQYGFLLFFLVITSTWSTAAHTPQEQPRLLKRVTRYVQKNYLRKAATFIKRQYQDRSKRRGWFSVGMILMAILLRKQLSLIPHFWRQIRRKPVSPQKQQNSTTPTSQTVSTDSAQQQEVKPSQSAASSPCAEEEEGSEQPPQSQEEFKKRLLEVVPSSSADQEANTEGTVIIKKKSGTSSVVVPNQSPGGNSNDQTNLGAALQRAQQPHKKLTRQATQKLLANARRWAQENPDQNPYKVAIEKLLELKQQHPSQQVSIQRAIEILNNQQSQKAFERALEEVSNGNNTGLESMLTALSHGATIKNTTLMEWVINYAQNSLELSKDEKVIIELLGWELKRRQQASRADVRRIFH